MKVKDLLLNLEEQLNNIDIEDDNLTSQYILRVKSRGSTQTIAKYSNRNIKNIIIDLIQNLYQINNNASVEAFTLHYTKHLRQKDK